MLEYFSSGLPRMPDNFAPANPSNPFADYTEDKMYDFLSNYAPVREVSAEYEYSNLVLFSLCSFETVVVATYKHKYSIAHGP